MQTNVYIPNAIQWPIQMIVEGVNENRFDANVFLSGLNENLQRELVWSDAQKLSYIKALQIGYSIGSVLLVRVGKNYQIIDGKQRINAIVEYAHLLSPTQTLPVVILQNSQTEKELAQLFLIANPEFVPQNPAHLQKIANFINS